MVPHECSCLFPPSPNMVFGLQSTQFMKTLLIGGSKNGVHHGEMYWWRDNPVWGFGNAMTKSHSRSIGWCLLTKQALTKLTGPEFLQRPVWPSRRIAWKTGISNYSCCGWALLIVHIFFPYVISIQALSSFTFKVLSLMAAPTAISWCR